MTDKPTPTDTPTSTPMLSGDSGRDERPGFIADLGFTLVVPWLVLWRFELPDAPGRSMWAGWWPVIVVVGLLGVALAIGVAQKRPRGFLPYNIRWALLAFTLVLPAWIAISLAEATHRVVTFETAAGGLRPALADKLADASPQEREQVREAVGAGEKLAEVVEQLEQTGEPIPETKLPEPPPEAVDPATLKTLKQSIGIADAIEKGQPLPPEFAAQAEAAGMDDAKILAALLVVAAALLAPMLGLSTELTFMLLQGLVSAGKLTVGNILRVALALGSSMSPNGGFDEALVRQNFERYGDLAESADILFDAARQHGADAVTAPLGKLLGGKPRDVEALRKRCRDSLAPDERTLADRQLKDLLRKRCQYLDPDQIEDEVKAIRGGRP